MGMRLIAIGNIVMIEYLVLSHYQVSYKWAWLVLTAGILTALLLLANRKGDS